MLRLFKGRRNRLPAIAPVVTDKSKTSKSRRILHLAEKAIGSSLRMAVLGHMVRHKPESASRAENGEKGKAASGKVSLTRQLTKVGLTRLATRSLPGTALVGAGIVASAIYRRGKAKRDARQQAQISAEEISADKISADQISADGASDT